MHGRDDAGADAVAEPQRIADGDHRLADHQVAAVAQLQRRQRLVAVNLQNRQIGIGIGADQIRRQLAAVGQLDGDLPGAVDHVIVGDDVSVRVNDESAAQRIGRARARPGRTAARMDRSRTGDALVDELRRRNVDDGVLGLLNDLDGDGRRRLIDSPGLYRVGAGMGSTARAINQPGKESESSNR